MTQHDDGVRLRHMLAHAREAVAMVAGRRPDELKTNRMLQLALVRLVEVIGEAASRVAAETHRRFPGIPWAQVRGMRNRLIHGYEKIDLAVLWDTIQEDLPPLIVELEKAVL